LTAIAHYNLLERMGEGAFSEIYRARDTKVGRTVALRLIRDEAFTDQAMRSAFLEDARAAAKLSHPNITTLFDVGEYEGGSYLAYEFASGISLRQECAGRAVNPRRAVELAGHIADALAEGHAQGLLHTDIRPETILVTHKGSAKLLEFGMAAWTTGGRIRARAVASPQALGADAVSVVSYMSPEQALGGSIDVRTDIFSLGVVLYEMLAGRHPFAAADVGKTLVNVTSAAPPVPDVAGGSDELWRLVARATAKEIDRRPKTAPTFSSQLRHIAATLDVRAGETPPRTDLLPLDDDSSGGKWWAIVIAGVVIAAILWWILK
jgi:eukaryotic-like serine/threonine-protein kinase